MDQLFIAAPASAVISLVFAYILAVKVKNAGEGTERMREIAGYIREGAMAFLKRQYMTMSVVVAVLFLLVGIFISWLTAVLYLFGALFSVLAGFFGMKVATYGNVRTANAAMESGMNSALKVAFRSGAVMGLCVSGLGLFGIGAVVVTFFECEF